MRKLINLLKEFCSIDVALTIMFTCVLLIRSEYYLIHPFYFALLLISSSYRFKTYLSFNVTSIFIGFILSYEYGFLISVINATFFLLKIVANCFVENRFIKEYIPFVCTSLLFFAYCFMKNNEGLELIYNLVNILFLIFGGYAFYGVIKSIKYQKEVIEHQRIISLFLFPFCFIGLNNIIVFCIALIELIYLLTYDKLETLISVLLSSLIFFALGKIDLNQLLILNIPILIGSMFVKEYKLFLSLFVSILYSCLFIKDFYLEQYFYQVLIAYILVIFINPNNFKNLSNYFYAKKEEQTNEKEIVSSIKNYLDIVLSPALITNNDTKERVIDQFNSELCSNCEKENNCLLIELRNKSFLKDLNDVERKRVLASCNSPYRFFKKSSIMKEIYLKEERKFLEASEFQMAYKKELENIYSPLLLLDKVEVDNKEILIKRLKEEEYKIVDIIQFNDELEIKIMKFDQDDVEIIKCIIEEVYQKSACYLKSAYSFSQGDYTLLYTFKNQYKIDYSFVIKGKNIKSGDYVKIQEEDQKLIFALSDGMTHSTYASSMSEFLIESLFAFLKINPDFNYQIQTINNLLYHKSSQESYATLDYLTIDLVNLNFSLFKAGSFTSFIYHNYKVQESKKSFPPLGILSSIEPFSYQDKLHEGDILVFMSDGFIDEPNLIIETILTANAYLSAKEIQERIYNILMQEELNDDDRTLCVLKIEKR